jgi:hypothetical protein
MFRGRREVFWKSWRVEKHWDTNEQKLADVTQRNAELLLNLVNVMSQNGF